MVGMPKSGEKSTYEPVMMASVSQGMIGSKMGDVVIKRDIPWRTRNLNLRKKMNTVIEVNGVNIHYKLEGPENGPALVFSNSLGTDLRIWDEVISYI